MNAIPDSANPVVTNDSDAVHVPKTMLQSPAKACVDISVGIISCIQDLYSDTAVTDSTEVTVARCIVRSVAFAPGVLALLLRDGA